MLGVELAAELVVAHQPIGIEVALFGGRDHGAAGFVPVGAVAETALLGERLDIRKRCFHRVCVGPELDLAHSGRVDQDAAVRQDE